MSEGATGGTCAETVFDGRVEALPGVATFAGIALAGVVHEFLFDPHGNVVGADQPVLLTVGNLTDPRGSAVEACNSPQGFTDGSFASTVELFPSYRA